MRGGMPERVSGMRNRGMIRHDRAKSARKCRLRDRMGRLRPLRRFPLRTRAPTGTTQPNGLFGRIRPISGLPASESGLAPCRLERMHPRLRSSAAIARAEGTGPTRCCRSSRPASPDDLPLEAGRLLRRARRSGRPLRPSSVSSDPKSPVRDVPDRYADEAARASSCLESRRAECARRGPDRRHAGFSRPLPKRGRRSGSTRLREGGHFYFAQPPEISVPA